jgi:hypothetical protein
LVDGAALTAEKGPCYGPRRSCGTRPEPGNRPVVGSNTALLENSTVREKPVPICPVRGWLMIVWFVVVVGLLV